MSNEGLYIQNGPMRCADCHSWVGGIRGSWRYVDGEWEHKCSNKAAQLGHYTPTPDELEPVPAPDERAKREMCEAALKDIVGLVGELADKCHYPANKQSTARQVLTLEKRVLIRFQEVKEQLR